jgi:transcriptional regulator with XRE-family HTH domain
MNTHIPWYVVATRLRKEQKLTLQKIADHLGVAKSTVGHWLTGHNPAPLLAIQEIALMLGTTEIKLLADDPFYISDPVEQDLIKKLRDVPDEQRDVVLQMLLGSLANLTTQKPTAT